MKSILLSLEACPQKIFENEYYKIELGGTFCKILTVFHGNHIYMYYTNVIEYQAGGNLGSISKFWEASAGLPLPLDLRLLNHTKPHAEGIRAEPILLFFHPFFFTAILCFLPIFFSIFWSLRSSCFSNH